jgi:hypothetical protein
VLISLVKEPLGGDKAGGQKSQADCATRGAPSLVYTSGRALSKVIDNHDDIFACNRSSGTAAPHSGGLIYYPEGMETPSCPCCQQRDARIVELARRVL